MGTFCASPIIMTVTYSQKKEMLLKHYWRSSIAPFWERISVAITKAIISLVAELLKSTIGGIIPLSYTSQNLTYWSNCLPYTEILSTASLKDANPTTVWRLPANPTVEQIVRGSLTPCNLSPTSP